MLRTRHTQYNFWAIIRVRTKCLSDGVEMLIPELRTSFWRTSRTIPTWPTKNLFHNLLFRMKRGSTSWRESRAMCLRSDTLCLFIRVSRVELTKYLPLVGGLSHCLIFDSDVTTSRSFTYSYVVSSDYW